MKDDRVYLQHIRDALQDIAEYCGSNHRAFLDDRMRQDATLRKLEIIGQAVKNLSEGTRGFPNVNGLFCAPDAPLRDVFLPTALFPAAGPDSLSQHLHLENCATTHYVQRLHIRTGEGEVLRSSRRRY